MINLISQTRVRHLLDTENLTKNQFDLIFSKANYYKENRESNQTGSFPDKTIGFLFYEPSTRTKGSFIQASQRLGLRVLDFSPNNSSIAKGESLLDTAKNLVSLGVNTIVLRNKQSGSPFFLSNHLDIPIISAGDGMHAHPTQSLIDAFTILTHFDTLENKKIAIIGDIRHSRVARSNIYTFLKLGAKVTLVGPPTFLPEKISEFGVSTSTDVESILDSDIIMPLRIQKERQLYGYIPSCAEYFEYFGIKQEHLQKVKANALIMHPGPINRGIEISSSVADCDKSVILEQAENGVFIRMAIISILLGGEEDE